MCTESPVVIKLRDEKWPPSWSSYSLVGHVISMQQSKNKS